MSNGATDWNPGAYARFRGLRLRPALDLLMQVPAAGPAGDVVDLGCGDGAVAPALRMRFPKRRIIGVDGSAAMLARARGYDATVQADAATWEPESQPALIFSNALLHWLPDHGPLFARYAARLALGGTLAVQMPRQYAAPSHALLRDLAAQMFPHRFDFAGWVPPVADPVDYARWLRPLGQADVWETEYLQRLDPATEGHPVRAFTASTAMRPFVDKLSAAEAGRFTTAYDLALSTAYPPEPNGSVLFPFRRLFIILTVH